MENYEVIGQIGKGSFGLVQKIKRKSDGKVLVWKEMNYGKMSEREKQQLVAEVNIIRELKHSNIVRYYDRIIDKKETKIFIIMEYCECGDLGTLLKKCKKEKDYIAEDVIWKIFTQVLLALNECHNRPQGKILHRDLKPANLFLDSQNNIKLGDFGLSKVMSDQSVFATTHVGTPYYMSPEQIQEAKYNEKSDIWSAGCLLYEMAALKPPFEANNHLSLAIKIKNGKFSRLPIRYSEELQKLVESMLHIEPTKRPSVQQLMENSHLNLRLKERRLRDSHSTIKIKEDEMKKMEDQMKERKMKLEQIEKELKSREEFFRQLEEQLLQIENSEKSFKSNSGIFTQKSLKGEYQLVSTNLNSFGKDLIVQNKVIDNNNSSSNLNRMQINPQSSIENIQSEGKEKENLLNSNSLRSQTSSTLDAFRKEKEVLRSLTAANKVKKTYEDLPFVEDISANEPNSTSYVTKNQSLCQNKKDQDQLSINRTHSSSQDNQISNSKDKKEFRSIEKFASKYNTSGSTNDNNSSSKKNESPITTLAATINNISPSSQIENPIRQQDQSNIINNKSDIVSLKEEEAGFDKYKLKVPSTVSSKSQHSNNLLSPQSKEKNFSQDGSVKSPASISQKYLKDIKGQKVGSDYTGSIISVGTRTIKSSNNTTNKSPIANETHASQKRLDKEYSNKMETKFKTQVSIESTPLSNIAENKYFLINREGKRKSEVSTSSSQILSQQQYQQYSSSRNQTFEDNFHRLKEQPKYRSDSLKEVQQSIKVNSNYQASQRNNILRYSQEPNDKQKSNLSTIAVSSSNSSSRPPIVMTQNQNEENKTSYSDIHQGIKRRSNNNSFNSGVQSPQLSTYLNTNINYLSNQKQDSGTGTDQGIERDKIISAKNKSNNNIIGSIQTSSKQVSHHLGSQTNAQERVKSYFKEKSLPSYLDNKQF